MNKLLAFFTALLILCNLLVADVTYFFADNPSIQLGVAGVYSWGLSSITTDGTKGFLSNSNIKNITLKNSSLSQNAIITSGFNCANVFATDSHLGFVNPLVSRFSYYYSGSASQIFNDWNINKINNQNLSINYFSTTLKYMFQSSSLDGVTTPYGLYPSGVIVSDYSKQIGGPFNPWYYKEYSAKLSSGSYRFSNFGATDVEGGSNIGGGVEGFKISNITDEDHMRNEMIADGYTDLAIPTRGDYITPMVIASSVPEPSALSLLAIGLGGLALVRRRRS
jgi:hypothetical protein